MNRGFFGGRDRRRSGDLTLFRNNRRFWHLSPRARICGIPSQRCTGELWLTARRRQNLSFATTAGHIGGTEHNACWLWHKSQLTFATSEPSASIHKCDLRRRHRSDFGSPRAVLLPADSIGWLEPVASPVLGDAARYASSWISRSRSSFRYPPRRARANQFLRVIVLRRRGPPGVSPEVGVGLERPCSG